MSLAKPVMWLAAWTVALCLRGADPAQAQAVPKPGSGVQLSLARPPAVRGTLTLEQALALAARYNPALRESTWLVRAASARVRDEAALPNPTLEGTVENFGGGLGSDRTETTLQASQLLELGGKRGARAAVARGEERLASAELSSREREVLAATAEAFLRAWWLQERVTRLQVAEGIGETTIRAARERTRAGAAPATEALRATSSLAEHEVERRQTQADLAEARRAVAMEWGAAEASFDSLTLPSPSVPDVPPASALLAELDRHPERMAAAAETMLQSERVRAARAERLPDVTVSGGLRHLAEVNATGFLAGVSLPLPLFNRHGALVQAAQSELDAARAREEGTRLRLQGELADARDRLLAARDRWDAVRLRMQPAAREALEQLRHGYQAGRFTYLDQLEGQRAALDADLLELETIRDTWSARLELERLLGRTLEAR